MDEAADGAALTGLLLLRGLAKETVPSTAAERCLHAALHFVLAADVLAFTCYA